MSELVLFQVSIAEAAVQSRYHKVISASHGDISFKASFTEMSYYT